MIYLLSNIIMYTAGAILVYAWLLFPGWMLWQHHKHMRQRTHVAPAAIKPQHVSILISAWNEADVIEQRIENLAALQYPPQSISVFIGTDGCTDDTAAIVQTCCQHAPINITLCEYQQNRGKASVLVDLVTCAITQQPPEGTVLVFTDANTFFDTDAISRLIHHLADPHIGGVCGRLVFDQQEYQPEQSYWSWETYLKEIESHFDSCLGANGAIYAIRPSCFWFEMPPQTIIDDFIIGMKVREAGLRMVFEPHAIAHEDLPATKDEWQRRVRIGSGAFQAIAWCRSCLHPRYGRFALFFWSHKVLRWFTPHLVLFLLCAACSALLAPAMPSSGMTIISFGLLGGSFAIALLACIYQILPVSSAPGWYQYLGRLHHFVLMQAALFMGFIRFCRGNLSGQWTRTPRNPKRSTT